MTDILLTTDCGCEVDDQFALAHLALSPAIRLECVVTTHTGEHRILPDPAAESTARTARDVLDRLSLERPIPVIAGSNTPLQQRPEQRTNPGADAIVESAAEYTAENRLSVLVIGAATDVAIALREAPDIADRIRIVAMGFLEWPAGGDGFNVKNDLLAWQQVMASGAEIVIGSAAVCKRCLPVGKAEIVDLAEGWGDAGLFLRDLLLGWYDRHPQICRYMTGREGTWIIWDEVTTAFLLGLTEQASYPRPRVADEGLFSSDGASGELTWITDVDAKALWADLSLLLTPQPS